MATTAQTDDRSPFQLETGEQTASHSRNSKAYAIICAFVLGMMFATIGLLIVHHQGRGDASFAKFFFAPAVVGVQPMPRAASASMAPWAMVPPGTTLPRFQPPAETFQATRTVGPYMGLTLHGSQQSRSPLVNWYALEAGIDLEMAAPRPSNHPFGQVPFLTDDGGVEVFESGAILLYLADKYGDANTAEARAQYTKWVVWSNSELDGLCFGAVPGDHRVRGTSMDKPTLRSVAVLEDMLGNTEWLVGGEFSVADVAVGSYLNYVPIFFPNADLSGTPNIAKYMQRCAERPAFSTAFGAQHAALVEEKVAGWLAGGGGGPVEGFKKMFGM